MAKSVTKEKIKLEIEKRIILGRKVKKIRRQGILPGNIFGKKVKSLAVQLLMKDFLPVYEKAGETGIVELKVKSEEKVRPALIYNVQLDPVSDKPLHTDFYQVDLKQKITTGIPVELIGEAPAVEQKIGILIQPLDEVEVEALPTELPEKFSVDVSSLKEVDNAITVAVLKPPTGVKIITSLKEVLAKIEPPAKEEVVAPPPTEETAAEAAPGAEEPVKEGKEAGEAGPKPAAEKAPEARPESKEELKPKEEKK